MTKLTHTGPFPTPRAALTHTWDEAALERCFEAAVNRACGGCPVDEPEVDEDTKT